MSNPPNDSGGILDHRGNPIPKRPTLWSRLRSASTRTKAILLSCAAVLTILGGAIANLDKIRNFVSPPVPEPTGPTAKVYFTTLGPNSDFEMSRGGRTLLFVAIPKIKGHVNRVVFGTALIRPVNLGAKSIRDLSVTTIYSKDLWHPSLGKLEGDSVTPISGALKFDFDIKAIDDRWMATRTISRLDPMGGAPFPVCFLLEIHGSSENGDVNRIAKGELEIRVVAPDWSGLIHRIDIRCVPSDSAEHFVDSVRKMAATLREEGYPDVPVILADTGGKGVVSAEGPTIIQASVDSFIGLKEDTLHKF